MVKKSPAKSTKSSSVKVPPAFDFGNWNFILFLTLALILLVVVLTQMKGVSLDLRAKAGLDCPKLTAPRAEDCAGGWTFKRDVNGCLAFFCEAK